ncbi:MAG: hypothetical protein Q7J34_02145 [Bacteroidales bacterium]|nr:hypothetical protein [Bacteroidales bacterium]
MLKNRIIRVILQRLAFMVFLISGMSFNGFSSEFCVPDTSLTFEKYEAFLRELKDETKYKVVPLHQFRQTVDTSRIIVGLKHDVDNNLQRSVDMAKVEYRLGIPATYYFLHTSSYYFSNPNDANSRIIPVYKTFLQFQNDWKHEVGFHSDLITLQLIHKLDPVDFLHKELDYMRQQGLRIYGSAAHGSPYCKSYHYINYYFFEDCSKEPFMHFVNLNSAALGNETITYKKGRMLDFDLDYEAYFLDNNKYYSDAQFIGGRHWNFDQADWRRLKTGDRVIFLVHPEHWLKVNTMAEFVDFHLPGQTQNTEIDVFLRTIQISYPKHKAMLLKPEFRLNDTVSDVFFGTQYVFSGFTELDFSKNVEFVVKTRNGKTTKTWNLKIHFTPSNEAEIVELHAGKRMKVFIDNKARQVFVETKARRKPEMLRLNYSLSPGALAFLENKPQKEARIKMKSDTSVILSVLAEDGLTRNDWLISAREMKVRN